MYELGIDITGYSMDFEKLFLYKQWSDELPFRAIYQIDQSQFMQDYDFARQQLDHMMIFKELFRSRLERNQSPHNQMNTLDLPTLKDLQHRIAISDVWFIQLV